MFCVQVVSTFTDVSYGALVTLNVAPPPIGSVRKLTVPVPNEPVTFSVHVGAEASLANVGAVPENVPSHGLTVTENSCRHTLPNWPTVSLGWRTVKVAVCSW